MARPDDRLALIEVLDREGRVLRQHEVTAWPLSIGRALDNDLVLDDLHVAPNHARVAPDDAGRLWLTALPSLNGVRIGRRTAASGGQVPIDAGGEPLLLGLTRLRVRLAGESLPAEQPLGMLEGPGRARATLAVSLLLWLSILAEHWVAVDPDSRFADWLPMLLAPPIAFVLWCVLWGIASKLFRHRFDFSGHWHLAVRFGLVLTLASMLLPQLAAALGWPWLFRWTAPALVVGCAVWLYRHGKLVLPQHARGIAVALAAMLVVGGAVAMTFRYQNEAPLVGPLYMPVLPHPGWRLVRPVSPERFVQGAQHLRAQLDERARMDADDVDDASDEED